MTRLQGWMQRSREHASGTVERGGGHMCSGNRCIRNDKSGRNPSWSRSESWVAQRPHMLQWQAGVRDRHAGASSDEEKNLARLLSACCMTSLPQKRGNLGLKQQAQGGQNLTFCRRSVLRHRRAVGHRRVCPSFNLQPRPCTQQFPTDHP